MNKESRRMVGTKVIVLDDAGLKINVDTGTASTVDWKLFAYTCFADSSDRKVKNVKEQEALKEERERE